MKKTVVTCDRCGKELKHAEFSGLQYDYNQQVAHKPDHISFYHDFCHDCDIKFRALLQMFLGEGKR